MIGCYVSRRHRCHVSFGTAEESSLAAHTRDAIRAAAVELFSRLGYEKTSLREIADRVGMTKAALYYHYPSKQELLVAIVEPLVTQWRSVVDRAETLPHTSPNVRLVLDECLDMLLHHRSIAGLFLRDAAAVFQAIGPRFDEIVALNSRLHAWLAGPSPDAADRVRAVAATEALGTALGWSPALTGVTDAELRAALLEAAAAVLRLGDD
jgi:AcrR family transcriptional regulator